MDKVYFPLYLATGDKIVLPNSKCKLTHTQMFLNLFREEKKKIKCICRPLFIAEHAMTIPTVQAFNNLIS